MAKMRLKIAKMRPKMAKMRPKMAKMRPKIAKRRGMQKHAAGTPYSPERHVYVCMHCGLFAAVIVGSKTALETRRVGGRGGPHQRTLGLRIRTKRTKYQRTKLWTKG